MAASVPSVRRDVWCARFNDHSDCQLFETLAGALRFAFDIPQTQGTDHLDWPTLSLLDHASVYQLCTRTATELDPIWVVVKAFGVTLHGTLADAVVDLTRQPLPHGVHLETFEDVWELCGGDDAVANHPDLPMGAVFTPRHGDRGKPPQLYRRFVQPDGAAYCAKVVEQVAADDILPVVGVPELVAEFL
jgi:hypothetical protein